MRGSKDNVRARFDKFEWKKGRDDHFVNTSKNEDLREVSSEYNYKTHMRIKRYLRDNGEYFLDTGCGPIPHKEYLDYSNGYKSRICIDFSLSALKDAKKQLGEKGVYILADVTKLPLKGNSVDGAVSLHTIYHIPRNEQSVAIREIHRVLKAGSTAVINYSWESVLMNITMPVRSPLFRWFRAGLSSIKRRIVNVMISRKYVSPENKEGKIPRIFIPRHKYAWFNNQSWGFDMDFLVWRMVNVHFMRKYIHSWLLGKYVLRIIYWFEDKCVYLAGRIGQYPMFIIKK